MWPMPEVVAALEGLPRPEHSAVRWTARAQWHITLRFLGEMPDGEVPALIEAIREVAASHPPRRAELGPTTARLSRRTLVVPVAGVDDLGAAVVDATRSMGAPAGDRPFRAHLTLARSRGDGPLPRQLAGQEIRASWVADELTLIRSHLERGVARYETVATTPLSG